MSPFARFRRSRDPGHDGVGGERVLILTPVKDAEASLFVYWSLLYRLTYPRHLISIAFLESDSTDRTVELLERKLPVLRRDFRRANFWKRDFGYRLRGGDRHEESIQLERRSILARSRNHLLMHALEDEDWVLWIDVDLLDYPPDIIETLLASGKDVVQPHCVTLPGGPTFDLNAWSDHGTRHMDDLRDQPMVRLDAVGGTMLLVRADLHRDGLVFPPFPYGLDNPQRRPGRGEIETEGLGLMAGDMGVECWGLPQLEIRHRSS